MSNCIISPNVPNTVWIVYDVVAPYQHCLETEADLRNVHFYLQRACRPTYYGAHSVGGKFQLTLMG